MVASKIKTTHLIHHREAHAAQIAEQTNSKANNFQTIAAKSLLAAKEQYSFLNDTSMKIDISSSDTTVLFNT